MTRSPEYYDPLRKSCSTPKERAETMCGNQFCVYIHVPFCEKKCPYCSFSSAPIQAGRADENLYLDALALETSVAARSAPSLDTLYIGGGTPTTLSLGAWNKLIQLLEASFEFSKRAEVTVEANPNSLTAEQMRLWKSWRVNRVSIGVQSTDDAELEFLGRLHNARQAADSVTAAKAAGFSVSVDLMFGLPGATLRNWARTLRDAVSLSPSHISIYQLSIEPGTPFAGRGFELSDGYAEYRYAQWFLPQKGYRQYEIASFAREDRESRHNLNYWFDGNYLGLGPAAWGSLEGRRYRNAPSIDEYVRLMRELRTASVFEERLEGEAAARQAAVLALRTAYGIDVEKFTQRHGDENTKKIISTLNAFPPELVYRDKKTLRLTAKGMRVANVIWGEIV